MCGSGRIDCCYFSERVREEYGCFVRLSKMGLA
jgi:hypothetical protein